MVEPAEPRLAASVVLVRQGPAGVQVFALQRRVELAFAGGTLVFPGGAVESDDDAEVDGDSWGHALGTPPGLARALVGCALRELEEEAGVVIAAETLVPASCWTTPSSEPLRFRAWFMWSPMPLGQEARAHEGEASSGQWWDAHEAVRAHEAGELPMWIPQLSTLREAAAAGSVERLLDQSRGKPVPWFGPAGDGQA